MAAILTSLRNTVIAGFVLAVVMLLIYMNSGGALDRNFFTFIIRWSHVICGVMWIGILWYFNFVQIPSMPKIPDEQKPAIGKVIAPEALFWFRWGAMGTIVFGIILAHLNGYLLNAYSWARPKASLCRMTRSSASACGSVRSCGSTSGSSSGRTRKSLSA